MKSISFYMIIFLLIAGMFVGQAHLKDGTENIYNITNNINWEYNYTLEQSTDPIIRINNIIKKGTDFLGYTLMESTKASIEFGYNHPEYNAEYLLKIIKYLIIYLILIPLISQLPIIIALIYAIIYLIYQGIDKTIKHLRSKRMRQKE